MWNSLRAGLPLSLRVVTVPFIEFLFFRLFLKHVLHIRIGFSFMTDFDVVCPAILASWILISTLAAEKRPVVIGWRTGGWKLNAPLCLAFLLVNLCFHHLSSNLGGFFMPLWYCLALSVLVSGFFVMVPLEYYRTHPKKLLILPAIIIAGSKLIFRHGLGFLWNPLAILAGHLVYGTLKPFIPTLSKTIWVTPLDSYVHVSNTRFTLAIGSGCSGMEGISFMVTALAFTFMIDSKRFLFRHWLNCVGAGVIFFYLLNVSRIIMVFLFANLTARYLNSQAAVQTALLFFHSSLGWVFHAIGLVIFYGVLYRAEVFSRWSLRQPSRVVH